MSKIKKILKDNYKAYYLRRLSKYHDEEYEKWIRYFEKKELSKEYINEIKDYWRDYNIKPGLKWYNFYYSACKKTDVRLIDTTLFYTCFEFVLNNQEMLSAYEDKNSLETFFADVSQPTTILKNKGGILFDNDGEIISRNEAKKILLDNKKFIVKKTYRSGGGNGISVLKCEEKSFENKIENILLDNDFIAQKFIKQSEIMEQFNSGSVNTIRITSLLWENEVYILFMFLRIGERDSDFVVCTTDLIALKENGTLGEFIDKNFKIQNVNSFGSIVLPGIQEMIEIVKKVHKRIPYFRFVGWDFTIDESGKPILLECNIRYPGLIEHSQIINGPLFGELTKAVTDYCCRDRDNLMNRLCINVR